MPWLVERQGIMPLSADVRIDVNPEVGRQCVACREFGVGEVVLRDEATLVWDDDVDGGHEAMLRAFLGASEEQQRAVMTMYRPPLDRESRCVSPRRVMAAELAKEEDFGCLTADGVLALLLIKDCNSHDLSRVKKRPAAGLFVLGSLVCHDCSPNCRFRVVGDVRATGVGPKHAQDARPSFLPWVSRSGPPVRATV